MAHESLRLPGHWRSGEFFQDSQIRPIIAKRSTTTRNVSEEGVSSPLPCRLHCFPDIVGIPLTRAVRQNCSHHTLLWTSVAQGFQNYIP